GPPGDCGGLGIGVVCGPLEGVCSVMGHRASGMETTVLTTDAEETGPEVDSEEHGEHTTGVPETLDLTEEPSQEWEPYDPALASAPDHEEHEVEIRVSESEQEVAPGVHQPVWTFGGTVPGPILRGSVGHVLTIIRVND